MNVRQTMAIVSLGLALFGCPARAPAVELTLNGLQMVLDDRTGGIRSMRHEGAGELLDAPRDTAGLLDLAGSFVQNSSLLAVPIASTRRLELAFVEIEAAP